MEPSTNYSNPEIMEHFNELARKLEANEQKCQFMATELEEIKRQNKVKIEKEAHLKYSEVFNNKKVKFDLKYNRFKENFWISGYC